MSEKFTEIIEGVFVVVFVSTVTMAWVCVFKINGLEKRVAELEGKATQLTHSIVTDNGVTMTQSISLMHDRRYYEVFKREIRSTKR